MTRATLYKLTYIAGFFGVVTIAVGSILTGLAYVGNQGQQYSPVNHFVSELGEVDVSELASVFNIGLIIGCAALCVFMVGVALQIPNWFRYVFGAVGLIAGISGLLVGVFPMNNLEAHTTVALTFFNTGWIVVGLFSLYILFYSRSGFPRWLIIPGIFTVGSFIAFLTELDNPGMSINSVLAAPTNRPAFWALTTFEWAVIIGVLIWVFCVSLHLFRQPTDG
jgi:hypothetical membrane protein